MSTGRSFRPDLHVLQGTVFSAHKHIAPLHIGQTHNRDLLYRRVTQEHSLNLDSREAMKALAPVATLASEVAGWTLQENTHMHMRVFL